MSYGLHRFQQSKQTHFVTFSCYQRLPLFESAHLREIFLLRLEAVRRRYEFQVYGYVVMPEHVHLLVSEPQTGLLSTAIQALKISVARSAEGSSVRRETFGKDAGQHKRRAFWERRYYDHNVRSYESFVQKLRYIHRNPVKRRLVDGPEEWRWSSSVITLPQNKVRWRLSHSGPRIVGRVGPRSCCCRD